MPRVPRGFLVGVAFSYGRGTPVRVRDLARKVGGPVALRGAGATLGGRLVALLLVALLLLVQGVGDYIPLDSLFLVSEMPLYVYCWTLRRCVSLKSSRSCTHDWRERDWSSRGYRGTSLIRKCTPLGPYRRPMPRVLGGSWGGGRFIMGEVLLEGGWVLFRFIISLLSMLHTSMQCDGRSFPSSPPTLSTHRGYRSTPLIRNTHPPRITIGP